MTIIIGPPSNGEKCSFPTNRPSDSLCFESGTSVDYLENVLTTDTPYQLCNKSVGLGDYVRKWCCYSWFPASKNYYEWAKICVNAFREAKTSHASSPLSDIYADGARHRSKVAKNFLNSNNIELLEWPGNSSDLNPIERTNMKNKVSEKQPPSGAESVKVKKEIRVKEISKQYCQSLIESMP